MTKNSPPPAAVPRPTPTSSSGSWVTWRGDGWSVLLAADGSVTVPPGSRSCPERALAEVAAHEWHTARRSGVQP